MIQQLKTVTTTQHNTPKKILSAITTRNTIEQVLYSSVYNVHFPHCFPLFVLGVYLFFGPIPEKTEYLSTLIVAFLYHAIKCLIKVLLILYTCCFIYFPNFFFVQSDVCVYSAFLCPQLKCHQFKHRGVWHGHGTCKVSDIRHTILIQHTLYRRRQDAADVRSHKDTVCRRNPVRVPSSSLAM